MNAFLYLCTFIVSCFQGKENLLFFIVFYILKYNYNCLLRIANIHVCFSNKNNNFVFEVNNSCNFQWLYISRITMYCTDPAISLSLWFSQSLLILYLTPQDFIYIAQIPHYIFYLHNSIYCTNPAIFLISYSSRFYMLHRCFNISFISQYKILYIAQMLCKYFLYLTLLDSIFCTDTAIFLISHTSRFYILSV